MKNLLACRLSSYGRYQDAAWSHLPSLGVYHIEIPLPEPGQIDELRDKLRASGLAVSSVQGNCDVAAEDVAEQMARQFDLCRELGADRCFVSVKAGPLDLELVYARLRAVGDEADKRDITVLLETHPDLVTNGHVGRRTMQAVDHPRIRVNFDTANVYYYNEDVDGIEELRQVADYVEGVHLKDTNGKFRTWYFPTLGDGIVDFPAVFSILNARGFHGPFTMELEGIEGVELDEEQTKQHVADSVAYLRRTGYFD